MGKIQIVADSTCDLGRDLADRYGIRILPLNIVLDMDSYCDGEEIEPDAIYDWANKHRKTPKTAAVSYDRAMELAAGIQKAGDEMIFFGISEEMSTTCNVMRLVQEDLGYERMRVIDSENLSTGIGLQVLRAAQLAREGCTLEQITDQIQAQRDKVRASFVVERLDYLAMGGRCSAVAALLGGKLKLKPRIEVVDGRMIPGRKYRGNQDRVILKYVQDMREELLQANPERVFITHSGCPDEVISQVRGYLEQLQVFREILVTRAGGVISSHCGPGTQGVLFYAK